MNTRYVQRIALLIGSTQVAMLAFAGKLDNQLSQFLVSGFNHVVSLSFNVLIQKILFLVFKIC